MPTLRVCACCGYVEQLHATEGARGLKTKGLECFGFQSVGANVPERENPRRIAEDMFEEAKARGASCNGPGATPTS